MNINKAIVLGRVTQKPEKRSTQTGSTVTTFSIATNNIYKDKDGEKHEDVTFHNIVVFGKTADVVDQYVTKGQLIYVEGRIDNRFYDKKDGTKGFTSQVIGEKIQFGPKPQGSQNKKEESTFDDNLEDGIDDTSEIKPEDLPF